MTDTITANSEPGQPLGLALTDQLGPMLRNAAALGRLEFELQQQALPPGERMAFIGPHLCEAAAGEIERLREQLEHDAELLLHAADALEYHREQTRPIGRCDSVIQVLRARALGPNVELSGGRRPSDPTQG